MTATRAVLLTLLSILILACVFVVINNSLHGRTSNIKFSLLGVEFEMQALNNFLDQATMVSDSGMKVNIIKSADAPSESEGKMGGKAKPADMMGNSSFEEVKPAEAAPESGK